MDYSYQSNTNIVIFHENRHVDNFAGEVFLLDIGQKMCMFVIYDIREQTISFFSGKIAVAKFHELPSKCKLLAIVCMCVCHVHIWVWE